METVGVKFSKKGRVYFFNKNDISLNIGDEVIVETERGLQYGFVIKTNHEVDETKLVTPLKDIIRIANSDDRLIYEKNLNDSSQAYLKAKEVVADLGLAMNVLDANYTFDRKQLLFNFTADDRIDFRELARRLAQIYKTRIELRQIGIRDKAREIGGLGPCGRFLCCNSFLNDLNSVTINMAKNQMLALNPTKINGVCGRLLCCLAYEDEVYTDLKRGLPNVGDNYQYNGETYKVIDVDILKRKVKLESENHSLEQVYIENGSN